MTTREIPTHPFVNDNLEPRFIEAWNVAFSVSKMLCEKYHAEEVRIIGSLLQRERFHEESDIDLAITNFSAAQVFEIDSAIALSAFANTRGGTVYIGIEDGGAIAGCTIGKETLPQWINQIKMSTFPSLIPDSGSGIRRIRESFIKASSREPSFEEIGEGFMVTVFTFTPQKTPNKKAGTSGPGAAILQFLSRNPGATRDRIATALGSSSETVKEYLEKLKRTGELTRTGGRKMGEWVVKR